MEKKDTNNKAGVGNGPIKSTICVNSVLVVKNEWSIIFCL